MSQTEEFWSELHAANEEYFKKHGHTDILHCYRDVGPRYRHYMLPPPNEYVFDLADLQFGRRDYYVRDLPEYGWTSYRRPEGWREVVGDRWAMYVIHEDFTSSIGMPTASVYDPWLLQDMLIKHPEVVRAVKSIADTGFKRVAFKTLNQLVSRFFRSAYRMAYQERMGQPDKWSSYARGAYSTADWDVRWKQACAQFDQSISIIAEFIVRHYTVYPDEWVVALASHVDLSQYHRYFTGSKTFFTWPKMVRIKDHSNGNPPPPANE